MKISKSPNIISATFVKGVVGDCPELNNGLPQVALIGRSNVGKSSVINSLTGQKALARSSSSPGRTQEINMFLINNSFYLLDLPGYGFAKSSREAKERLQALINWYLFLSGCEQALVVLIIDAELGPTASDLEILRVLIEHKKNIVIVANKIDKIKKSAYKGQMEKIQNKLEGFLVIPYSAKNNIGINQLKSKIFDL